MLPPHHTSGAPDDAAKSPDTPCVLQENGALASWNEKLEFAAKYRDLPFETQLAVTVWHFTEKEGTPKPLGGATMRMFSKKGRLKTVTAYVMQEPIIQFVRSLLQFTIAVDADERIAMLRCRVSRS